ncbi:hypothetical protein RN22_24240 [Grimontia sp. AD028]|uniref:hypothetical protein n=1 Tax=Grimontia sp. AD028 TaxID=1581149 RepID=UPI00061AAFCE|nr:hypothetical protein [Grimontia sp. AD028]KKD57840.1 hypothetical protein RN22_24240 [Grimontia sp. AD028]
MISDLFPFNDGLKNNDLDKIDDLVCSNGFLGGLGVCAKEKHLTLDFPHLHDVSKSYEMMTSQEIWDLPEPLPYQYFPGILEDEAGRLQYETGLNNTERENIAKVYRAGVDRLGLYLFDKIDGAYTRHNIEVFLSDVTCEHSHEKGLDWIIKNGIRNEIEGYFEYIVKGICYGGLYKSPIFSRVYEAFLTGGIPCGWVGPTPEDGGEPVNSIQLLHFGQTT